MVHLLFQKQVAKLYLIIVEEEESVQQNIYSPLYKQVNLKEEEKRKVVLYYEIHINR